MKRQLKSLFNLNASCVLLLLSLLTTHSIFAQDENRLIVNDPSFNIADTEGQFGYQSEVRSLAIQPDGKIIAGSLFNEGISVVRYNPDRTIDHSFNIGSGFNSPDNFNTVYALAIQPDGKILVGGKFTNYNGATANGIVRLNSDGSLDTEFQSGVGFDRIALTFCLQSDGKILVGGTFTSYRGVFVPYLVRLNSDGSIDDTFLLGTGFNNSVVTIMQQPDGKILIGGHFTQYNGMPVNRIIRLNLDGSRDSTFTPPSVVDNKVSTILLQPNGKLVLVGRFSSKIIRLNENGDLDNTFNPAGFVAIRIENAKIQQDGKILVGGTFQSFSGIRCEIVRLNADGSLDSRLSSGKGFTGIEIFTEAPGYIDHPGVIYDLKLLSNGKILVGGGFSTYDDQNGINKIALLNLDGTLDTSFLTRSGFNNPVRFITIQPDNKILVGGLFTALHGADAHRIARLNADGTLDNSFNTGTGFDNMVRTLIVQSDGKILVGGNFLIYNGVSANGIVRLNTDGTLDHTFNSGSGFTGSISVSPNLVNTLALQADNKILVGGNFTQYNGEVANRIIRLNSDGTVDPTFETGSGFNAEVTTFKMAPDGKFLAGGKFFFYGEIRVPLIARLNLDGSLDTDFNPNVANLNVYNIALQSDGKIIVGGDGPVSMIRLNTDGSKDTSFKDTPLGVGVTGGVTSLLALADDKILVGSWSKLFRLNADGSPDESFIVQKGLDDNIYSIAQQQDGNILVGGSFTSYDDIPRNYIARLTSIPDRRNKIQGRVFYDENNNGIMDEAERGVSRSLIKVQPGNLFYPTDENGNYTLFVGQGDFTVEPVQPQYTASIAPASRVISFTSDLNVSTLNDFAVRLREGIHDMSVSMSTLTRARPGFDISYHIIYKNLGTATESGIVNVVLDPNLQFISSTPAPTSISGNNLEFSYSSLLHGNSSFILLNLRLPADISLLGRDLLSTASINVVDDIHPTNNQSTMSQRVTGSYDPNDISVSPQGYGPDGFIPPTTERLYYTIRFQNMGTANAQNISVRNLLNANLDVSSFTMESSSHAYTFVIENGEVTWQFADIDLPYATLNEPASHGYIIYSIAPRAGVAIGAVIQNKADIYFDYNPPVLTNTVINTIKNPPYVPVHFNLHELAGKRNTEVLVPIRVSEFNTIQAAQFSVTWDPLIATYVGVEAMGISGIDANAFGTTRSSEGVLTFAWFDEALQSQSLTNNSTLFSIRLRLTGNYGESTPVTIGNSPLFAEVVNDNYQSVPMEMTSGELSIDTDIVINGEVHYPNGDPVSNVAITADPYQAVTDVSGHYSVQLYPSNPQQQFTFVPSKTTDPNILNGIDVQDVATLRRHLLGTQPLTNPYQLIASDVNTSSTLSVLDITLIQALILGIHTDYSGNEVWKFVDARHEFTSSLNPFPYPSSIGLEADQLEGTDGINFTAVKSGDVNFTRDNSQTGRKNAQEVVFDIHEEKLLEATDQEKIIEVPIRVKKFSKVAAYQFTLSWNTEKLQYQSVVNKALESSFGKSRTSDGKLSVIWDNPQGTSTTLSDDGELLVLTFKTQGNGGYKDVNITSDNISAKVYDNSLSLVNHSVIWSEQDQKDFEGNLIIYPNPFKESLMIEFYSTLDQEVSVDLIDYTGRILQANTIQSKKGKNVIEWKSAVQPGVYVFSVHSPQYNVSKKVIKLN